MIKAIAFDLDGVLVDACDWHKDALNLALKEAGQQEIDPIAHLNTYNGLPTKVKLEKLNVPVELRREIEIKKQLYTEQLINSYCHYDNDLVKTLWLLKQDNYKLACVTNSTSYPAKLMLKKSGVLPLFDYIITNEFGGKPKPHKDPYVFCINLFKISPKEMLVVEDSQKGIEAAKSAGCRILEVPSREGVTYQKIKECIYNDQQFLF